MRNLSKCKLFLCFRPVVDIDAMLDSNVSDHKHGGGGGTKKSETEPLFFRQGSTKFSESWIMQQPPKRTLCRVFKAMVLGAILNKRGRRKNRCGHDSFGSESKFPESASSSSSSSYSSSPTKESQPKSLATKAKEQEIRNGNSERKSRQNEWYGIYMMILLLSLLFTVLWGKLLGVILTSMCLYFACVWKSSSSCYSPSSTKAKHHSRSHNYYYYGRRSNYEH